MIAALRRAAASHLAVILAALLVTAGAAVAAGVGFTAETRSQSTFAGGWIGPATGLATPSPSGYDAVLSWTPGTHGPVTGQQLWSFDNGTTSNCTSVTYASPATMPSATTSTYTVPNTSGVNGHWLCYQLVSTSASSWTSSANFAATQLGLVAKTVAITNSGNSGKITNGDKITITFNQNVAASSVPTSMNVCAGAATGVIIIGDTVGSGCSNGSDPYTVGVLNGINVSAKTKLTASATVSGAVVTVTITQNGPNTSGGPATFTPALTVLSAATTDQAQACIAANCTPTASGGF